MIRLVVRPFAVALVATAVVVSAGARTAPRAADPVSGRWNAALAIPSGDVPFVLDLALKGRAITGAILNGPERQPFSSGTFDGTTIILRLDYYDGTLTAKLDGAGKLSGEYVRQTSKGVGRYVFHAERAPGVTKPAKGPAAPALDVTGDWILTFVDKDGKVEEVDDANFTVTGLAADRAAMTGSIIPVSGDSGLLSGTIGPGPTASGEKGAVFRLSRFDGIHVTLLTGEVASDGTMSGVLASGQSSSAQWTATRKDKVAAGAPAPEDPFTLTTVKDPNEPFAFSLPDPASGATVALTDERFRGKVVLVDIFGTWCPNCHDEAPVLADLYKKYRKDGLEVVLLAYEYTPDAARNARQIEIFRKKYGIEFPILAAGTLGEGEIGRTLPQLVNFGAYPTTIFVGRDGRVRKIHAGFSGPATGEHFPAVKLEFDELVKELLAEKP